MLTVTPSSPIEFLTPMPYLGVYAIALAFTFFITVYLVMKRFYSINKLRMSLLIMVNAISSLALFGLLSKPSWQDRNSSQAILVTAGVQNSLEFTTTPVFILADAIQESSPSIAQPISSVEQLTKQMPNLHSLEIQGHGLFQDQLEKLGNIELKFKPSPIEPGLVNVNWNKQLILGQSVTFNARYLASKSTAILTANIIDLANHSVAKMNILHNEAFQLVFQPKLVGHYLYKIEIRDNNQQLLTSETIAVNVNQAEAASITIIQSAPSFEAKHLANWVSQYQAKVVVHTKISKNKFMTQRFNIDPKANITLSQELLKKQDLLIINGQSLIDLTTTQHQWIKEAVENGLGLLVLADNELVNYLQQHQLSVLSGISLTQSRKTAAAIYPTWSQSNVVNTLTDVPLARIWANLNINQGEVLIADHQTSLNVAKALGQGMVSVSILKERFRWLTQGELSTYSHYWQYILAKISRANTKTRFSNPRISPPLLNSFKQQQCVIVNDSSTQLIANIDAIEYNLQRSITLNNSLINNGQRCGGYWPEHTGWHKIRLTSTPNNTFENSQFIYVSDNNHWQSWQQFEKVTATLNAIEQRKKNNQTKQLTIVHPPINASYFWWLFILSASVLWVEQKTRSTTAKTD